MGKILECYIDDKDYEILKKASAKLGRSEENLAEAAISETLLEYSKNEGRNG